MHVEKLAAAIFRPSAREFSKVHTAQRRAMYFMLLDLIRMAQRCDLVPASSEHRVSGLNDFAALHDQCAPPPGLVPATSLDVVEETVESVTHRRKASLMAMGLDAHSLTAHLSASLLSLPMPSSDQSGSDDGSTSSGEEEGVHPAAADELMFTSSRVLVGAVGKGRSSSFRILRRLRHRKI